MLYETNYDPMTCMKCDRKQIQYEFKITHMRSELITIKRLDMK